MFFFFDNHLHEICSDVVCFGDSTAMVLFRILLLAVVIATSFLFSRRVKLFCSVVLVTCTSHRV